MGESARKAIPELQRMRCRKEFKLEAARLGIRRNQLDSPVQK